MNILVIDSFLDHGHDQFNSIQIDALLRTNNDVVLVGAKNHFPRDIEKRVRAYYSIPNFLFNKDIKNHFGTFWDAFWEIFRLLYIRLFIYNKSIDRVVFLRYNVLVTFIIFICKPCFLFDHFSATEIHNKFKRFIVSHYPDNYIHLTLNNNIKDYLKGLLPNKKVFTVKHGILPSFKNVGNCSLIDSNQTFVFCSTVSSCDRDLLIAILNDEELKKYLKINNIIFIIKTSIGVPETENIIKINGYISSNDYQYYIKNAICVFLPYDQSFGYRVSGIFFECVANDTYVISSNIEAFSEYKRKDNPISLVSTPKDFIRALNTAEHTVQKWDKADMDPCEDWQRILNKI